MSRWRAAFYAERAADKIDNIAKNSARGADYGGFGNFGNFVRLGPDGDDPHPPGARLLLILWRRGISVAVDGNGAVTLRPPPYNPRVPGALLGACRHHRVALAAWIGADASLPLLLVRPLPTATPVCL